MTSVAPVILRVLASSHTASAKAGEIVRDVMAKGELGIVEKVGVTFKLPRSIFIAFPGRITTYFLTCTKSIAGTFIYVQMADFQGKNDLQTLADSSAQKCIIAALTKCYPKATIIGEEGQLALDDVPEEWTDISPYDEILKRTCPKDLETVKEEDVSSSYLITKWIKLHTIKIAWPENLVTLNNSLKCLSDVRRAKTALICVQIMRMR